MIGNNWIDPSFPENEGAQNTMSKMPLGLGMSLMKDEEANMYFNSLSSEEQGKIIGYIQVASTGQDAKNRVKTALQGLKENSLGFL